MERKKQNMMEPEKYPLGKQFYRELRAAFRATDSPLSLIDKEAERHADRIAHPLTSAMVKYKVHGQRGPLVGYLAMATSLNISEIMGVCAFAWELKLRSPAPWYSPLLPSVVRCVCQVETSPGAFQAAFPPDQGLGRSDAASPSDRDKGPETQAERVHRHVQIYSGTDRGPTRA